jgi:hypothetical protein
MLAELKRTRRLRIPSRTTAGRVYEVPVYGGGNVLQDEVPVMRLCIGPAELLPVREAILAHKLYIEPRTTNT